MKYTTGNLFLASFEFLRISRLASFEWMAAGVLICAPAALAADQIWQGGDGNFDNVGNPGWSTAKPGPVDNAIVNNGAIITINTNQASGDLRAGDAAAGTGSYSQTAGTVEMGGWMRLGTSSSSTGTYNLTGGTLNSANGGHINVGEANGGTGFLSIGGGAGAAQLTINAGGGPGAIRVGGGGVGNDTGVGTGTLTLATNGTITNSGELWLGHNAGSVGTMNMTGGVLNQASWLVVGGVGSTGTLNLSGGTINKTGALTSISVAGSATTAGTLNQTGGTINNTVSETWIGETGIGIFNLSNTAGTSLSNLGFVNLGRTNGSNSTVNLNGNSSGPATTTLAVTSIRQGSGTAVFNFNGGILKASTGAIVATFMTGLTRANVRNGGAVIDTNGLNPVIGQALVHSNIGGDNAIDGGLTKTGAGTLTLTGANTYTGATVVSAGTLLVNGSLGNTSGVAVADGATLGGSATIAGSSVIASGGTISPGNSVGTINLANLNLQSGSNYIAEVTGNGTNDLLNVSGNLAINGMIKVLLGYSPQEGDSFDLANFGSFSGSPTFDFSAAQLAGGLYWKTDSFSSNGIISVIPEPSVAWLGLVGGLVFLRRRRNAD